MLTTLCNSEVAQPLCSAGRSADPVARRLGSFLLFVITLLLPPVVCAQTQTVIKGPEPSRTPGIVETVPVVVNGKARFHVVGVSAYPAKRRAYEIARRIDALARNPKFDPKTLRITDVGTYHQIFPGEGGKAILAVLEADAKSEGLLRTVLAETLRISRDLANKHCRVHQGLPS